jgi:hypothetical protein
MTQAKITLPLFVGIAGTIVFNLSPIALGYGVGMNLCFMLYAGVMLFLSVADRRVLGYAIVLSACNPANTLAYMSYSFLLAGLTVLYAFSGVGRVIWELGKRRWWYLYLAAFILVGLSVPFWPADLRAMLTEVKNSTSRLGYLVVFPLAIGLTIRTPRDGVRAVSLLCLMAAAFFVLFYFRGSESMAAGSNELQRYVGNIYLGFQRTGVCIPLAVLATCGFALGVNTGLNYRAVPFYLTTVICVIMIMQLGSIGSALAMICGMGVIALGYFGIRLSLGRILFGFILFFTVGSGLYWAVFHTENFLSQRIEEKTKQLDKTGIDRMVFWEEGTTAILNNPFGSGWSTLKGHSDWLLYLISYGWATGLLYIAAAGTLFLSMWRSMRRNRNPDGRTLSMLLMVGLAGLTVYMVNSIFDMPSAGIGYYQTEWALILTAAAVAAVTDSTTRNENRNNFGVPVFPYKQQYRRP